MRNKRYKIKSYGNIYGPNRGNKLPIKIILTISAVVMCSLLGWSLYMPVYNFFMGFSDSTKVKVDPSSSAPPSSSVSSSVSSSASTSMSEVPSQAPVVELPPNVETPKSDGIREIYIPKNMLNDYAVLDKFLDKAKENGYTGVVLDAKSATGEILFLTENETAIKAIATAGDAFDAVTVVKHIKEKGLVPIAKLHAFRDDRGSRGNNDMGVKYYDTKYTWLDNSPENGGRGWLNPYSPRSREYIAALCGELSQKGFSGIIVDSLQFPSGEGREKAGYGDTHGDKSTALKECIEEISKSVEANGSVVTFAFDVRGIESDSEMLYGGDVTEFSQSNIMLCTSLDNLDAAAEIASKFKSKSGRVPEIMLQAYNDDGSQPTHDDMKKAIEKLEKIKVEGYCLFNPQGIYQF